jgi:hypothetical protein
MIKYKNNTSWMWKTVTESLGDGVGRKILISFLENFM